MASAAAVELPKLVVLGDSIASGEDLDDKSKCFAQRLASTFKLTLSQPCLARAKQTSTQFLDMLNHDENKQVHEQLAAADYVVVSIGNFDLLELEALASGLHLAEALSKVSSITDRLKQICELVNKLATRAKRIVFLDCYYPRIHSKWSPLRAAAKSSLNDYQHKLQSAMTGLERLRLASIHDEFEELSDDEVQDYLLEDHRRLNNRGHKLVMSVVARTLKLAGAEQQGPAQRAKCLLPMKPVGSSEDLDGDFDDVSNQAAALTLAGDRHPSSRRSSQSAAVAAVPSVSRRSSTSDSS